MNAYSQRFADRLFAAHPTWRALAAPDPAGDAPPGSLLVAVTSPGGAGELVLRTYGGQVTVEFGAHGWHEHFGAWSGPTEDAIFDAALAFVTDILADRIAAAVGLRGD
ncbi:MAG TPA: hypothetical protein VNA89_12355, partial [Gemmatimonadaceae bacterium]|nr:hypothetical protein [Gemmatimonadaceae bacterium]